MNYIIKIQIYQALPNVIDKLYQDIFSIVSSSKTKEIKICGRPNGFNLFYKILIESENGKNLYTPNRIYWYDIPNRDEQWKKKEIKKVGQQIFDQEYELKFISSKIKYEFYDKNFKKTYRYFDSKFINLVEEIKYNYGDDNLPYILKENEDAFNIKSGEYLITIKKHKP